MEEAVKRQPGIQLSGWVSSMYKRIIALSRPPRAFSVALRYLKLRQ